MNDQSLPHRSCPLGDEPLVEAADRLRALHVPGAPLVLVNVWDVASAVEVHAAGARAIATSSAAIAASLGETDDNTMPLAQAFGAVRRVADAVPVPVTADVEGGYGLDGTSLAGALLGAGAVGCNIEDSDHERRGELVGVDVMAGRIAALRQAATDYGVDLVINARIDTMLYAGDDRRAALVDVVRRGHAYIEAGADCLYPVGVGEPATAARLVASLGVPINTNLGAGVSIAELADAGVSRVSFGPRFQREGLADLGGRAGALLRWAETAPGSTERSG